MNYISDHIFQRWDSLIHLDLASERDVIRKCALDSCFSFKEFVSN